MGQQYAELVSTGFEDGQGLRGFETPISAGSMGAQGLRPLSVDKVRSSREMYTGVLIGSARCSRLAQRGLRQSQRPPTPPLPRTSWVRAPSGRKSFMQRNIAEFVEAFLLPVVPPENPLRCDDWAGLAFDRNRHEDLAPVNIWSAFFATHNSCASSPSELDIISAPDLAKGMPPVRIAATLESLLTYLTEDVRFLKDHYVASVSQAWIVRLDQDVTLFSGEAEFMCRVVGRAGGRGAVLAQMRDDFDPGSDDSAGLERYLLHMMRPI